MSVTISIEKAIKKYGENTVVSNLDLEVKNGELFTLLGPSGCGKTTLLRMIAGFATIEGGTFKFDDTTINNVPSYKRNIGMVFQNYAIFPHLTVRKNVEYGLKVRKLPGAEIRQRVNDILEVVQITEYQDRLPENLSGGQQQRVALARAIVIHPDVLLMDEPLSNLDAKLRVEMRGAIREIQKRVNITTVYVTHDQEEALAISDRIAVMNQGVIQQIGSPESIYARPYNIFVSTFVGHSNIFTGSITPEGDGYRVTVADGCYVHMDNLIEQDGVNTALVVVRPEEFMPCDEGGIEFTVKNKVFLGKHTNYELSYPGMTDEESPIQYSQDNGQSRKIYDVGEKLMLRPNPEKINLFSIDGEQSLILGVTQNA